MPEMSDTEGCTDAPIPEDLRNEYDLAGTYGKYPFSTEFVRILIERIAKAESARDQLRIERDAAREALRKAYVAMAENNAPFDPDVWADAVNSVASALATPLGTHGRKP